MKFSSSSVMDRSEEAVRDNIARAEEYLQPRMREKTMTLFERAKNFMNEFPMTTMLTVFAGGLLLGAAAMGRRQSIRDMISLDLSEPIQRGGRMIGDTMEAAGQILREGSDTMRTMAKRDMSLLRKQASRWQRKLHL